MPISDAQGCSSSCLHRRAFDLNRIKVLKVEHQSRDCWAPTGESRRASKQELNWATTATVRLNLMILIIILMIMMIIVGSKQSVEVNYGELKRKLARSSCLFVFS